MVDGRGEWVRSALDAGRAVHGASSRTLTTHHAAHSDQRRLSHGHRGRQTAESCHATTSNVRQTEVEGSAHEGSRLRPPIQPPPEALGTGSERPPPRHSPRRAKETDMPLAAANKIPTPPRLAPPRPPAATKKARPTAPWHPNEPPSAAREAPPGAAAPRGARGGAPGTFSRRERGRGAIRS